MASPNNTTVASADDATMSSDEGFIMISHDGVGPLSQLNGLLKSNPSEEHVRVVASTSHFLLEPHSKLELGMLDRYLSHDPPRESPSGICVMPPHELSERLRLLAKFQETFAREVGKLNCRMSKNSLAAWLVAPLDVLRKGADVETYGMGGYLSLRRGLIAISQLICQCMLIRLQFFFLSLCKIPLSNLVVVLTKKSTAQKRMGQRLTADHVSSRALLMRMSVVSSRMLHIRRAPCLTCSENRHC